MGNKTEIPANRASRALAHAALLHAGTLLGAMIGILGAANPGAAQSVRVDITPGHATNVFSPLRSLGAGVDAQPYGAVNQIYVPATISQMLSAGWGPVSYRLYTELSVQDWHWNPQGAWSASNQGYFTGAINSSGAIKHSFGYRLPHRGFTHDQGNDDDYSRLTDGEYSSYWKSNPYLSSYFTHEADSLHPQWAVVDLGATELVNAIRIYWAEPHAIQYQVQYWSGADAIGDPAHGSWVTFPGGAVSKGTGGTVTLRLSSSPLAAEFLRIVMSASSNTCDSHGHSDLRNCRGYAIAEVGVGTLNSRGQFADLVRHCTSSEVSDGTCGSVQTVTYASSVDPWHAPANQVTDEEQAGLDLVFTSGLTRHLPVMMAVGMLYGTPENSVAEISYLKQHHYPISYVEMGEEPDGQYILPEDYGALYLQWAAALHKLDATLKLGGPVFQGVTQDVPVWPNAKGDTSWLHRFINYLKSHNRIADLSFMSFEHYPFDPCDPSIQQDLLSEPGVVQNIVATWRADGLPAGIPMLISEYNFSADTSQVFQNISGALWHSDFLGSFLTAGGAGAFLYEYEPTPLVSTSASCTSYGAYGMFSSNANNQIRARTAEFFSTQMITQQWAEPVDAPHHVYPASSNITDSLGHRLVTAYAVRRPDGEWSLLMVNKDPLNAHSVSVDFHDAVPASDHYFYGSVTDISFAAAQYRWHPNGPNGYPSPEGPALTKTETGGAGVLYTLPASSIKVLRGAVR